MWHSVVMSWVGENAAQSQGNKCALRNGNCPVPSVSSEHFLGFTNYYSSYIQNYAHMVAILQEKLKVPRNLGKKGSKHKVEMGPEEIEAFNQIKTKLCEGLVLQRVNPDKPYVLRVDASR